MFNIQAINDICLVKYVVNGQITFDYDLKKYVSESTQPLPFTYIIKKKVLNAFFFQINEHFEIRNLKN